MKSFNDYYHKSKYSKYPTWRRTKTRRGEIFANVNRHVVCDRIVVGQIVRSLLWRKKNQQYNIFVRSIHPLSGLGGGWIVEFDEFDMSMRFEYTAHISHDFNVTSVTDITPDGMECGVFFKQVAGKHYPQLVYSSRRDAEKNKTYRRW